MKSNRYVAALIAVVGLAILSGEATQAAEPVAVVNGTCMVMKKTIVTVTRKIYSKGPAKIIQSREISTLQGCDMARCCGVENKGVTRGSVSNDKAG